MKALLELLSTIFFVILFYLCLKGCGNDKPLPQIAGEEYRKAKEQFERGFNNNDNE